MLDVVHLLHDLLAVRLQRHAVGLEVIVIEVEQRLAVDVVGDRDSFVLLEGFSDSSDLLADFLLGPLADVIEGRLIISSCARSGSHRYQHKRNGLVVAG